MRVWSDAGYHAVPISVNLSPRQYQLGQCAEQIQQTLDRYGLDTSSMAIEFTEELYLSNDVNILRGLNDLHGAGLSLYLDDFGKGFSSINQLHSIPLKALKIDRSFVAGISENPGHKRLSEAIIGVAHKLGLEVIAEGVETAAQKDFLKDNACEMAQGHLFSHSLSPQEFTTFLLRH